MLLFLEAYMELFSWFLPTIIREVHDLVMNLPTYLTANSKSITYFLMKQSGLHLSDLFLSQYSKWVSTLTETYS